MTARRLGAAAVVVDMRSARSKQRKVGASEIGVCRRRAGYSHHGTPFSNPENSSGISAILGTWLHTGALDTMRRQWGCLIETRVEDTDLKGHVDAIDLPNEWRARIGLPEDPDAPDTIVVEDLKSKKNASMVNNVRVRGPKRSELYQAHLYAGLLRRGMIGPLDASKRFKKTEEALLAAVREHRGDGLGGLPVETIRLRYFSRAGESNEDDQEYPYEQPFDPAIEAEAWEWVREVVTSTDPDELPRDQEGPGLSIACDHCPWLAECWGPTSGTMPQSRLIVTDQDLADTLREYHLSRANQHAAEQVKDLARAKLDGTDAAIYVSSEDATSGFHLSWSGGRRREPVVDVDAMVALLEKAGVEIPMRDPGPSSKSISVTPWQAPEQACGKPVGDPIPWREDPTVESDWWVQDRQRGGWTLYRVREEDGTFSHVQNEATAGQFAKRFPAYVDPRPPCIMKKGHTAGKCRTEDYVHPLNAAFDPADETADLGDSENADLTA